MQSGRYLDFRSEDFLFEKLYANTCLEKHREAKTGHVPNVMFGRASHYPL